MTLLEVTNSPFQDFPRVLILPGDIHSLAYRRRSNLRIGHTATEGIITKLRTLGDLHKPFVNAQQQLWLGLHHPGGPCALAPLSHRALHGLHVPDK